MADITMETPRKRGADNVSNASRKNSDDNPDTPRNRGDDDSPHLTPTTPAEDARTVLLNQITWGAVLAGVVVMMVLQLILNMIGLGVGAASVDVSAAVNAPSVSNNPSLENFSYGAAVWWVVSGVIASFVGGYAAGRLAGVPKESTAGWHGLTAWAAATLLMVYLVTSAMGGILGGVYSTVAGAASTAVTAGAQGQQNGAFAGVEQSVRTALGGGAEPAQNAAVAAVRAAVTGDPAQQQQAREQAAQAIAQAQQIPVEQARVQVQNYENQYRQAVQTVRQSADEAADTIGNSALVVAAALIFGAFAAWFGGRSGAVHPTLTDAVLRGRQLRAPFERRDHHYGQT